MFKNARVKLTAWYLAIIMSISILFSAVIYRGINAELQHFERRIPLPISRIFSQNRLELEMIVQARRRLVTTLVVINLAILGLAGAAGYFLAGKTLSPIEAMVLEQNRFISDASHELKTPLTSLKSAFEVFLRNKTRTLYEADAIVKESIGDVNRLQSLSESLLAFAQYQKPNNSIQVQRVSLKSVLAEAIRKILPLATQKDIVITKQIQDEDVRANRYALVDLFVILLDNAVKYTDTNGAVNIFVKKTDGHVSIMVKDTGIGIHKKDLPHIFDRFYRADSARSGSDRTGYGLGLAIARKIVDLHKGSISATSVVGKGSTFIVRLPRNSA
ncbi:hypothetical protein A2875_04410 [Candidatus Gottesmanbacteria bacterium RIFCSPHIGHO2_01_FULL_46_14]|uniref:histidine kinase n=3 Tax=Candidatus Gottesmaniibacteriota TaxID=1752720 RepID=A0A1F5ZK63_9BACT|nr:MAG: Integral membrane sensor signal transduction histidine kinase [Candidatus Gottesmanbacteria bacterium GW2011_GWA1_47_8]OGG12487.1 MAG: hypothetical protein A2875_04410 [Candidatus Gottesmanbacteria bacterium RIFCSPHIGHO2_01_FULL_46_14]OGG29651.1 MAG: hypothetical protein A2971_01265 [Candidatus Gottesmanbacteria bacterium RIFCSPLOWO2_01_FULL_46_21]